MAVRGFWSYTLRGDAVGVMEISSLRGLLNTTSSVLSLSCSETLDVRPVRRYFSPLEQLLKLLVPVLDALTASEIASEEPLIQTFQKLTNTVVQSRQIFQNCDVLMSKLYFVLQAESCINKLRSSVLDLLRLLKSYHGRLPPELEAASLESIIEKMKLVGSEEASRIFTEAIGDDEACQSWRTEIADVLDLQSNQELLIEAVALEKMKENEEQLENTEEIGFISRMIDVVMSLHDRLVLNRQSEKRNPTLIPADFCCPLSLELMVDPVIVSSGQTYERLFIKKWVELGLTVCPKTRQPLSHTNLIPNYTVKALIGNWCETNGVKLPDYAVRPDDKYPEPAQATTSGCPELVQETASGYPESVQEVRPGDQKRYPNLESWIDIRSRIRRPHVPRVTSKESSNSRPQLSEVEVEVRRLVADLESVSVDAQRGAAAQLRLLAKHSTENRIVIANCGAIKSLVSLLCSADALTQENAVTALLNLSINDNNKTEIANADAIKPLIHVLETGTPDARSNSAATLYSLSVMEDNKVLIGRSGAIEPLVHLLSTGSPRGRKDAATALFNLSIYHENKARIVGAGAVKHLVDLMDPAAGMVDKAVAVLANLATIPEGRSAIGDCSGIPAVVEVVELGSARAKENAAAALLQLCMHSSKHCSIVLHEGAVPPLVALSQSGTPRGKEKAQALLNCFRNQRHGNGARN